MERLLLVTDETQFIPPLMVPELLKCIERREDFKLVAVCLTTPRSVSELVRGWWTKRFERRLQEVFSTTKSCWPWPKALWLRNLSRRYGFPIIAPPNGNLSDDTFLREIQQEYRPTLILNCYGLVKLPVEFLALADIAVNYHNGKLPEYRGVRATNLSVYHGDLTTGFTFHHMTEGLDEGAILIEGNIPVFPGQKVFDLEHAKAKAASDCFNELLNAMTKRETGRPQLGTPGFFSRRDWRKIRAIDEPQEMESDEIRRRLEAFSVLKICIEGHWYDITELALSEKESDRHRFRTSDGVWLRPARYGFLPYFLYAPIRRSIWEDR